MTTFIEVPFPLLCVLVLGACAALSWSWVLTCYIAQMKKRGMGLSASPSKPETSTQEPPISKLQSSNFSLTQIKGILS